MRRSHLTIAIIAAGLVGCSDSPSPTQIALGASVPSVRETTLRGTVILNPTGRKGSELMLLEQDSTLISLTGDQAAVLSAVVDAEVEIHGLLDDAAQLAVQRFLVLVVGGQPVSDGVLDVAGDGFVLRLTTGGDRTVIDPPEDLQSHVGDRVWIAGPDDASPTAFGVILAGAEQGRARTTTARRR